MPTRALYLLTSESDVPFEDDGLRDGEHLRAWMNDQFRALLTGMGVRWLEVRGDEQDRLRQALVAVDQLLADGWHLADPLG